MVRGSGNLCGLRMEGPPMTFMFHHGGLFKKNVEGDMVYELDNTEVLMGVDGDTLDVFFVRGYYRELGYIEAGNCWWKDHGVLLSSGLTRHRLGGNCYRKTYCFNVNPVKGQDLWEKTPHPTPVPPLFKAKPGRPTKKRRRDKEEQPTGSKTKMKRKYNPIICMYYGEIGHNKRSCAKKKATEAAAAVTSCDGAEPEVNSIPHEHNLAPADIAPSPPPPPTVIDISQSESIPPTQETQQEQVTARPPKLQVIKGKARLRSSPKPIVAAPVAISA
ncbi:hypothetical protein Ahy_B05g078056 [Arachis hypogaea]|uniref:PB1-like domain-containing protein n=1 Tax=Arachis hypogaea TaxID=3818 RepID=A0A444Z682_ARAHY|nr:hypothetical protein Ahy_B05g078056 [Arachis hypogaea]